MTRDGSTPLRIVHEGRGGHVEIDGRRYAIEHVEGGRFVIRFPSGQRHRRLQAHLDRITELVDEDPGKWTIENGSGRVATRSLPKPPGRAG